MGKFSAYSRLSQSDINELFADFAKALSTLKNSVETANFIKDILSEQEVIMLARRLQIARLLDGGLTYEQIKQAIKASETTIAKVHTWLKLYGDGYRLVLKRTKPERSASEFGQSWQKLKRKYPMYFWPELLLKEIVKSANKKEKQQLVAVIGHLKEKTKLSKELLEILNNQKYSHTR